MWYAKRAKMVYSVESDDQWYQRLSTQIATAGLKNVSLAFCNDHAQYSSYMAERPASFDLVVVDGEARAACVRSGLSAVRRGGMLYLDNSDKHSTAAGGDTREAERQIREAADTRGGELVEFVDFAPAQAFVQQGLLWLVPK
ncbi:MAG: hypothetical protein JSS20_22320 [Proteobacteria bacterium]|nr:hypothetical protein [Pseudomonadota bacterium]